MMHSVVAGLVAATALFPQTQLKYGAQRNDFLHRWYERPLHQDTSFADAPGKDFLNVPAWRKTVEALRLGGFDGVSYFTSAGKGRDDVLVKSQLPGAEAQILFEVTGYAGEESCFAAAEKALKQPNYFRLDGRIVLPLRGRGALECTPEFAAEVKRRLTEKFGDKFLVLPYGVVFRKGTFNGGHPTAESVAAAKESVRALLRAADGFFYQGREAVLNRRLDPAALATVTSVIRDVLAEDEFRGKKRLGVGIAGGHENTYRWQYTLDSTGTAHLADSLAGILPLKPDIVKCMEWDEENENTFFRPTVFNGFTHLRLTHWFKDVANGRAPSVFPGDDASVPNLILSYRKSLVAGEPIEVEVRNIPDGTFSGETLKVAFAWKDTAGRTVRTFAAAELKADEMSSVWFTAPAAELIANRILLPELTVTSGAGSRTYVDGLFPLDLNATRTLDHKWVKQALREQPSGVTGTLEIGDPDVTGVYTVRGSVSAPKRIRSVEVLDDMDSAYVHALAPAVPADCEQVRIGFSGFGNNTKANGGVLNGTIRFRAAPGAVALPYNRESKVKIAAADGAWTLKDIPCNNWGGVLWAHVPKSAFADGEIVVDLAPHFTGTVRLADLLKKDVIGFNSVRGCGLTVMRYLPTAALPRPLMEKEARFAFRWKPLEKTSVLRLQVIDEDYRVWHGSAKTIFRPSGRKIALDVFDRVTGRTGAVTVDAERVETVACDFDGSRGSALAVGSGRSLSGMVGASAELAQAFGRGESHYGQPLGREIGKPALKNVVAPASGWGCLSLQMVPGFAGFTLEMKVKPDGFGRRQGLLSSGNCGLDLFIDETGTVQAVLSRGYSFFAKAGGLDAKLCGAALRDGEWNVIRLVTDRRTAWLEVNGVRGESIAYEDYFPNQRYTLFGASHPRGDFFRGQIGSLRVTVGKAEPARPWTHRNFTDDAEEFRFAVLPDRAGGDFRGAFTNALAKVNLLRPAFVMTIGDLVPGAWTAYDDSRRQYRELQEMVKVVEPPFFFVPGNHDLIAPPRTPQPPVNGVDPSAHADSNALWKEFHGETYYSFVYKNTLFVVLNSNETNDGTGFSDRQYAWVRETLAAHPDVRWTFFFMHHPAVWTSAKWETFEDVALSGRRYSVFAGDWHQYLHAKRLGRDYYVLSVAGGCSTVHGHRHDLRPVLAGADYGEMDHITWVTMTKDGPRVANLTLDGILPGDYINELTTKSRCAEVALDRPVSPELKARIASNKLWRAEHEKGNDVWVRKFGYNLTDCTECIQKALDSGARRLVIDAQRGPWITGPVVVRSNTEVIVDDNVEIVRKPGAFKPGQPVFDTSSATNAVIRWR